MGFAIAVPKGTAITRVATRARWNAWASGGRFAFATKVENGCKRCWRASARTRTAANIEITAAILLDALRIPREGFTASLPSADPD